jgi:hypothetical protein
MRFMMLMIPRVYQGNEGQKVGADFAPSAEDVDRMMKYNEQLANSRVLISLDGLHPPGTAVRVSFKGGTPTVTNGPFAESNEVLGGYWMIRAKSREEAIDWGRRVPAQDGDTIEIRQVFEVEEFGEEARKAADNATVKAELDKHRKG